ncbi:MAG: thiamine diphosphokinase [Bacteroidota bacterium]
MKSCIIIANGEKPSKGDLNYLIKNGVNTIVAADGGANSAYKLGVTPNYIIGDFDSIKPEVKEYFSDKSELIHISRQNDTDVEKALKYLIKKKFKTVYLLGGTGDRLDHSICNLGIVIKFFTKIKVVVIHGKTILFPYAEDVQFKTIPNETISLYAFNTKTIITSKGLKYPLNKSLLPFGDKESTSNMALSDYVNLKIEGGIVFVIRELKTMKKYDLIFDS